jgi:hypothetical protein
MIVKAIAIGAVALLSGVAIGYSYEIRSASSEKSVDIVVLVPPVEAGAVEVAVGSLQGASVFEFAPMIIEVKKPKTTPKPPPTKPKFFDFEHATCDQAESVRGQVLRCSQR